LPPRRRSRRERGFFLALVFFWSRRRSAAPNRRSAPFYQLSLSRLKTHIKPVPSLSSNSDLDHEQQRKRSRNRTTKQQRTDSVSLLFFPLLSSASAEQQALRLPPMAGRGIGGLLPLIAIVALCTVSAAPSPPPPQTRAPPAPPPRRPASSIPPGELPPMYGNYCGFQMSACTEDTFRLAPIDALDAACKRHDRCWCRNGNLDCACDLSLLSSARELLRASAGLADSTRTMANAVRAYFTVAPCVCRERRFCVPTCGRSGCTWGGPGCRQAVSPGLGGVCAI
jgi:hypothetical protein